MQVENWNGNVSHKSRILYLGSRISHRIVNGKIQTKLVQARAKGIHGFQLGDFRVRKHSEN